MKDKVDEQYARDVARMNPEEAGKMDDEYSNFLKELGGGRSGGGGHDGPPRRPGKCLPPLQPPYILFSLL
jgi:hypothetical protein